MNPKYLAVVGAFAIQFTVIGSLFSLGLYIKVFEAEFGWSRTLVSGGNAVATLMMGTLAIFAGRFSDKLGPRRVLLVSGVCFSAGLALLSQINHPWQFYALMASLFAIGLATHDVVTLSTIAHWFDKRRGLMTAVVKVGTALGQVFLPLLVAALIVGVGWRSTFLVLAAGSLVILLLAALLMRYPTEGEVADHSHAAKGQGLTLGEARQTRTLWKMWTIQLLFFSSLMTVPVHLAAHGMDLGLSTSQAAVLLSFVGGASVAGRLVLGALVDRIGCRNALSLCLLILMFALGAYAVTSTTQLLFVVTAVYGFAHGALFVVVSPTVAYYFGMKAHGAIFGSVLFMGTFGSAIGPIAAGASFDLLGSYLPAFIALALFAALALVLARSLPKLPDELPRS